MDRLKGKRALVTGGTTGIGLATAKRFAEEGARVAVTGANPETLAAAKETLGGEALVIEADAGDAAAQTILADQLKQALGRLDAVFVNAGVGEFRPLEAWDEAAFDRSIAVNLKGPFFLVRALLPILANPVSIVLNGSINAHIGMPNSSVYSLTKAGILSLARTLSGELVSRGIRVNVVSPGPVATRLHRKIGMDEAAIKALTAQIPLGRRGKPDEIADAVVFLASDEGGFCVGSELIIDGGMSTL
jgi:NAD(P)-dependent dehydrogenase (short-subunit alcohol dehydrogenase family)